MFDYILSLFDKKTKYWDSKIEELIFKLYSEKSEDVISDMHICGQDASVFSITTEFGEIWVSNYPYGFGYKYNIDKRNRILPSFSLRLKLGQALIDNANFFRKGSEFYIKEQK